MHLPRSDLAGRRVLIIEDESLVTMMLEDMLADIGCEVAGIAFRYADAFKKAGSLPFDVSILDINLNGEWTIPIAELLTERGRPFLFSTGYDPASVPDALHHAPVLQKPFQQPDLERALRAALAAKE